MAAPFQMHLDQYQTACQTAALSALHGFLYVGVTSIYDAGNNTDLIIELRRSDRRSD